MAPNAKINDGLFDVVLIPRMHPLVRVFYLPLVQRGKHTKLSFVKSFTSRKVLVNSKSPIPAHIDGELMESMSYEIEMTSNKLTFIV